MLGSLKQLRQKQQHNNSFLINTNGLLQEVTAYNYLVSPNQHTSNLQPEADGVGFHLTCPKMTEINVPKLSLAK